VENQRLVVTRQAAVAGVADSDIVAAVGQAGETPVAYETIGDVIWGGLDNTDSAAMTQVVLFMFLSTLTAAGFLVQDRRLGMATRKAAAPVSIAGLVLGETLGRLWIALFQAGLIVAVTALLFDVDWGDPFLTGAVLLLFSLVATGFGVLLGTALNNPESAGGIGVMIGIVLAALGGAMAPVEIFPEALQTVARLTPHFWAIDGLQSSLTGGTIGDTIVPLAVLTGFAAVVLALSTVFYRLRTFGGR
jgi:ABC-2 type transport system permease protein